MEFIIVTQIMTVTLSSKNEVMMEKPIYIGFAFLELSKRLIYTTYYDKLQP